VYKRQEDIQVSEYLRNNNDYLATSRLTDDAALVAGDPGIFIGDGSLSKEMNEAMTADTAFNAAGNFAAQTTSLDSYADSIVSNIANEASVAQDRADTATLIAEQTATDLRNLTGVNIDEEMTHIVDLEAKYEAAATLIATIQDLFQDLLNAVR